MIDGCTRQNLSTKTMTIYNLKKKDKSDAFKRIKLTISKDLILKKKNAFDIITSLWFREYSLRALKVIEYPCVCAF